MEYVNKLRCDPGPSFAGSRVRKAFTWLILAGTIGILASCIPSSVAGGLDLSPGTLIVQIAAPNMSRTLAPNLDMNIASYIISGTGPNSASFSTVVTGTAASITGLTAGAWTVAVDGKNAGGTFVSHGDSFVQVAAGTAATANISMAPIAGPGTLSLTLTWSAAQVTNPSIQAQLMPAQGSAISLAFSAPSAGSSSLCNSGIQNGWYTLTLQIMDNGKLVMGAVAMVQIAKGQTTSGTFDFTTVSNAKGVMLVDITPQLLNPIEVTTSGQSDTVESGTPMTVGASVPDGTGNVTHVWYLNGTAVGIGESLTLNTATTPLAEGSYRLDVVTFTTNGLRAGSATFDFTVSPVSPADLS